MRRKRGESLSPASDQAVATLRSSKRCTACGKRKAISSFSLRSEGTLRGQCKECLGYAQMLRAAKRRADATGIPFGITSRDLPRPTRCPLLGIRIGFALPSQGSSPSLDRITSATGYVRGNILVVSTRANRIKNDASLRELVSLGAAAHNLINSRSTRCRSKKASPRSSLR